MSNKVWVMMLSSGTQVIGEFHDSDDHAIYFSSPFEMSLSYDVTGRSKLYVSRYLPYAADLKVAIMRDAIESMVVANPAYEAFYKTKVKQFDELRSVPATDDTEDEDIQDLAFENDDEDIADLDESLATHRSDYSKKH